jgi:serine/threonine protein kinase
MELVEGAAFLDHVRPGGQLDERKLRAALPQLTAALSALHAHGLVHRDVKPHNVLVTPEGRVVLLDFGLVAGVAHSESNVVGTPAYMAPEQGLLRDVGPAVDWYAVGALLYEALTGALPFLGAPLQVMIAKQHELPRRPGELAGVPDDLDALSPPARAIRCSRGFAGLTSRASPTAPARASSHITIVSAKRSSITWSRSCAKYVIERSPTGCSLWHATVCSRRRDPRPRARCRVRATRRGHPRPSPSISMRPAISNWPRATWQRPQIEPPGRWRSIALHACTARHSRPTRSPDRPRNRSATPAVCSRAWPAPW